jgi:DNA-binding response OmpR family regulator
MTKKILLLDDDCLSVEFMRIFLEDEGYIVYKAHSCAEARSAFLAHEPDLAIIDYELLDGSGIDFAKYAHSIRNVKIILASGYSNEHLNDIGINTALFSMILIKPIDLTKLKNIVSTC